MASKLARTLKAESRKPNFSKAKRISKKITRNIENYLREDEKNKKKFLIKKKVRL